MNLVLLHPTAAMLFAAQWLVLVIAVDTAVGIGRAFVGGVFHLSLVDGFLRSAIGGKVGYLLIAWAFAFVSAPAQDLAVAATWAAVAAVVGDLGSKLGIPMGQFLPPQVQQSLSLFAKPQVQPPDGKQG